MSDHPSFMEAIQAKREEGAPFDLWWRGVMATEDVKEMRRRVSGRKADESKKAGGASKVARKGRPPRAGLEAASGPGGNPGKKVAKRRAGGRGRGGSGKRRSFD